MRLAIVALSLAALSLGQALAQSSPPAPPFPTAAVAPAVGDSTQVRLLTAEDLPASSPINVLLIDPSGAQTTLPAVSDASGNLTMELAAPDRFDVAGLYRVVIPLDGGKSISTEFAVGDGEPHLFAQPFVFSPFSAIQILGIGLPPNQQLDLVLSLSNDRGDRTFSATTDAAGNLAAYIWPQQVGATFFETGPYRVRIGASDLTADFTVQEKPIGAMISVDGPVSPGQVVAIHLRNYRPNRDAWIVYAAPDGMNQHELLVGTTSLQGSLDAVVRFPDLPGGQYLLATPYDWGETSFTLIPPTPTPTPTDTPTPTLTPTPTATPLPPRKPCKKGKVRRHGKCVKRHK